MNMSYGWQNLPPAPANSYGWHGNGYGWQLDPSAWCTPDPQQYAKGGSGDVEPPPVVEEAPIAQTKVKAVEAVSFSS